MKRIHINESKLRRLIESVLNELDIRTKLSAAEKAYNNNEKALAARMGDNPDGSFVKNQADAAARKSYRQHRAFMGGLENDIDKHFKRRFGATRNPEDRFYDFGGLKRQYRGNSVDTGVHDSKDDLNKTFDDYIKRKAYYDDGKWIDTRDSDWDEEKAKAFWSRNESIVRRVTENVVKTIRESQEQEEPYLWIEIAYYDDDESVEGLEAAETDDEMSHYDYNYGAFPEDGFEHATMGSPGETDSYYTVDVFPYGAALLSRKAYLSEIDEVLKSEDDLYRASDDAREFIKKYCPQFLG